MNILKFYIAGLKISGRNVKMAFFLYALNLIMGILVAIPLLSTIKSGFGSSMLPHDLLKGFDFTSFSEFMRQSSKTITPLIVEARWIIILYFFVSIFFAGGILKNIHNNSKFQVSSFFKGCTEHFIRFFKLFLYITFINLLAGLIIWLPAIMILGAISGSRISEPVYFYGGGIAVIIHLILIFIFQIVSLYSKIKIAAENSSKVVLTVFKSFGFIFKHFADTLTLALIFLISTVILFGILYFLNKLIGTSSGITILIMFIVQQAFIFIRVFIRIWSFASQSELFRKFKLPVKPELVYD